MSDSGLGSRFVFLPEDLLEPDKCLLTPSSPCDTEVISASDMGEISRLLFEFTYMLKRILIELFSSWGL
jgi:hypothetical protein